jgi:hypothetical protein
LVSRIRRRVQTGTETPDGTVRIFFTCCLNAASEPGITRPPEGTSAEMAHLPEPSPVETSTRTADPLLAKHGRDSFGPGHSRFAQVVLVIREWFRDSRMT